MYKINGFNLDQSIILLYDKELNLDFHPLPHMPILGSSNSAANKNMMSKIWTNGEQLSDWVENILGKEEIVHYEQFLLLPQCFKKLSFVNASKWVFME